MFSGVTFLIDKGLQLGLALRFFVSLLFVAILSGWAVYYAIWQTVLVEFHGMYLSRLYHVIGQRLIIYGLGAILALSLLSIFFPIRYRVRLIRCSRSSIEVLRMATCLKRFICVEGMHYGIWQMPSIVFLK